MPRSRKGEESPSRPRGRRWTVEEIARLREVYGLRDDESVAAELGRPLRGVRAMARKVFGEPQTGPWRPDEVESLRHSLGTVPVETIALRLARSKEDVQARIAELARVKRRGPWSGEELAELKRLYGSRTDEDLALIFGRRLRDVRRKAGELCMAKDKAFLRRRGNGRGPTRMPRWKPEELQTLQRLYPRHSNLEIAQRLNRSVKSVVSKAYHMQLKKDPARLIEMGKQNVQKRYHQ